VNDACAVAAVAARHGFDGLDSREEQRNKHDVEPHRRQHERPQWALRFARLHQRRKAEVSRDHGRRSREGFGHGNRASIKPTTQTKKTTPRMNGMPVVPA
jgi:hypothetical protein